MSSGYARVYFYVPRNLKKANKLIEPVEIPIEDYIDIRYEEHHGNKSAMAYYILKHYLGNQEISHDDISMKIAAGCPMYVYEIDEIIENGGCPEIKNGEIIDKKKPQWQLDQEERFKRQLEAEGRVENTNPEETTNSNSDSPQWQSAEDERSAREKDAETLLERTKSDETKKATNDKQFFLIMGGVALMLILMGLLAKCVG